MAQPLQKERTRSDAADSLRKRRASFAFSAVVILLALGYTLATGPFRAPDEPNHFFRAYEIAEGHLVAKRPGGGFLGDRLPLSLEKVARAAGGFPRVPNVQTSSAAFSEAWKVNLKPDERTFLHFPGAALHSPAMYLPAIIGISVGKLLHARPLLLLYLARISNAVFAGWLIGLALSRIWRHAPYLVTIALLPMCLFQVGNLTSDALTFGITFFWLSEVLRALIERPAVPPRLRWILLAPVLSQVRFPYPFLGLLVFAIPAPSLGPDRTARLRFCAVFLAALLLPSLLWISIVQGLRVQLRPDVIVDPGRQIEFIVSHPLRFLHIFGASLHEFGYEFWRQTIGVFGWLNLPLPTWILAGVTLCLGLTICSAETKHLSLTLPVRSAFFALATAALMLTAALVYLAWNSVGAPKIEGWQGRYAIPILPLLAAALANEWLRPKRWVRQGAIAFSLLANIVSVIYLARATWL